MSTASSTAPTIHPGQHLATFPSFARTMILSAIDIGGTLLDLTAYDPGSGDRPIAVFERRADGALVDEWSLAAYVLGLQSGSAMRDGVLEAIKAAVATIFDGADLDPRLEIEILIRRSEPAAEAV